MINTINNITKTVVDPVNKRWKLALIGTIACIISTAVLFIVKEYSYLNISIGGIIAIVGAYIGGDTYRRSTYDELNYQRFTNQSEQTEIIEG